VSADKHVNWFALEKACEKPGCPVCTIVAERASRYIDNMLFEHVSDRGFRAKFREAGGFCPYHARNLDSFRDGLAVAILGFDVLSDQLPDLGRGKVKKSKGVCPACAETERVETEFLGFLAETSDAQFTSFFTASDGLCVPHYRMMLSVAKRVPAWLETFQIEKYTALLERSKQFIECSAWGRQADFAALSDKDKVVWKELALALRGSSRQ
jgi:hypothetical protein